MFSIGQEVVCIDACPTTLDGHCELVKDQHYFIRWEGMYQHPNMDSQYCVRVNGIIRPATNQDNGVEDLIKFTRLLEKITNKLCPWDVDELRDVPFRATRFAPIKKTNISVLQELLVPIKVLEPV